MIARADPKLPNDNGWQDRHNSAMAVPRSGFEAAMVQMLRGWHHYAEAHRKAYESPIGDDGVLGPEWEAIGKALRGLLNGQLGRLNGGTLDAFLRNTMLSNDVEPDA